MRCATCQSEIAADAHYCSSCGRPTSSAADDVTRTQRASGSAAAEPPTGPSEEGRFLPGTVLAERYRIVTLLGRGGMGEVYRATDVKLGQPAALKFLPEALSRDAGALQRFYNEVRLARQIAHPNVCRVYDLGEFHGLAYISMEFIDGEDLGSLLRRIGRVPADKALEMARQLCAALAAAHEKGILHRDLKPANIMVDGRGRLRVMDFGLAAVAAEVKGADIRSGTYSYMAPEQLTGREVTPRSDIYSLGLVMYEMFTGRRPFQAGSLPELLRLQEQSRPASLATQISDLDPAVDRVLQRCLDADPAQRPPSALSVAAGLPGGDPLAAALAAGELPSPELVAAAGQSTGMSTRSAMLCVALLFVGLAWTALMSRQFTVPGLSGLPHPPEVLTERASRMLRNFGYATPTDTAAGIATNHETLHYLHRTYPAQEACRRMANPRPSTIQFWYRESPVGMRPVESFGGFIQPYDPPLNRPGMVTIIMDRDGGLQRLDAVPPQMDDSNPPAAPINWTPIFEAAGLDPSRFTPTQPKWHPQSGWDQRAAWEGTEPDQPGVKVRLEAAAWRGRFTYANIIGPWNDQGPGQGGGPPLPLRLFRLALLATVPLAMLAFARYNAMKGRGDRRGAAMLGWTLGGAVFVLRILTGHHGDGEHEIHLIQSALSMAAMIGVGVWIAYLALEPPVRRYWPQTMISWSRLVGGRWRDPLVGSHILAGLAAGAIMLALSNLERLLNIPAGEEPQVISLLPTLGLRYVFGGLIATAVVNAALSAILAFFCFFLIRLIVRNERLAALVFVVVFSFPEAFDTGNLIVNVGFQILGLIVLVFVLLRYGLLATAAADFLAQLDQRFFLTLDWGAWYGTQSLCAFLAVAALAAFAFHSALGGRRLLPEDLLGG